MNPDFSRNECSLEKAAGAALRRLRTMRAMSLAALSDKTGIAVLKIAAIENGYAGFGAEQVRALTRALRCHPSILAIAIRLAPLIRQGAPVKNQ